jgi:hypothetical protein
MYFPCSSIAGKTLLQRHPIILSHIITIIRKKYRLTKWGILCLPKEQGGLGIINLEVHNICLLSKWIFKLINEDEVWRELLSKKYLKNNTIGEVR